MALRQILKWMEPRGFLFLFFLIRSSLLPSVRSRLKSYCLDEIVFTSVKLFFLHFPICRTFPTVLLFLRQTARLELFPTILCRSQGSNPCHISRVLKDAVLTELPRRDYFSTSMLFESCSSEVKFALTFTPLVRHHYQALYQLAIN